jgi:hypothetical protein
MSICPEAEFRKGLGDLDFWYYVMTGIKPEDVDYNDDTPDIDDTKIGQPCPICRSTGACGFDSEGRPMIHTVEDEDNE